MLLLFHTIRTIRNSKDNFLDIFQLPPRPQNRPANETIQPTSSQPVQAGYPTQQGYNPAPPAAGYNPTPPGYPQQPPPYSAGPPGGMPMPQPIGFAGVGMYV